MGRVQSRQPDLCVAVAELRSPGNRFYERLNAALDRHDFDAKVEALCAPYYTDDKEGWPSIPPGRYFGMVMIGHFENLGSERGIAWRCADSFSLKAFLGLAAADTTPTHSTLSRIRSRLGRNAFDAFHVLVLGILKTEGLVKGELLALDSTTMAANASMASTVRKDTRETYGEFVVRLSEAAGEVVEGKEDLARFDRRREGRGDEDGSMTDCCVRTE